MSACPARTLSDILALSKFYDKTLSKLIFKQESLLIQKLTWFM